MASPGQLIQQYEFGVFAADIRSGELRKHGIRIRLQERPFQLLIAMLERPGEIVTREELRQRLWSDGTFVDFDHSISSAVNRLRSALNDSANEPRYIETVGSRGYRFLADVKPVAQRSESIAEKQPAAGAAIDPALRSFPRFRRISTVALITALVAALTIGYIQWRRARSMSASANTRVMLAVLPFDNLTGDPGQDYFSDGLTEEMISQLGRLDPQHLAVIARTSVMHYKHSLEPLDQIGRELGVQYVLEGSVRRDADKVRVTAQLIQLKDQTHVWARQYDRELKGLLLLEGEIAGEISDEIQMALGTRAPAAQIRQSSLSPEAYKAYNLYLRGLYFLNKRTVDGFQEAIKNFQEATAKDPNNAPAYAGLADCYALIGGYSGIPPTEFFEKARASALRALAIDGNLPEAHTALALIVQNYDWDWQTAEKEFQRAIELNPNYATGHQWYAEHLMWRGRFDEALRESERARELDPLSLIIAADHGAILYYSRQYDLAIKQFRSVQDMEPNFPRAGLIFDAYVQKGMLKEAELLIKPSLSQDVPWVLSRRAYLYGRLGRRAEARLMVDKLLLLNRRKPFDAAALAVAYLGLGDKDQTLVWLNRALSQKSNVLMSLKVDPAYDSLRSDPHFQALLQSVGPSD